MLGTWQQIVLIELDTKARDRSLVLQITGEWEGFQIDHI
jgi:thiamine phosphate synthase YjbQ (UPF0047 family)